MSFVEMGRDFLRIQVPLLCCFHGFFGGVIIMAPINCHGAGDCHLTCKLDYNELRCCLVVTLAAILDSNSFG